jgi:hypothetical protein
MRLTSCHGNVRGGLAEARNLGAITPLARSGPQPSSRVQKPQERPQRTAYVGDPCLGEALGVVADEPVDVNQSDMIQHASPAPQILEEALHNVDVARQCGLRNASVGSAILAILVQQRR